MSSVSHWSKGCCTDRLGLLLLNLECWLLDRFGRWLEGPFDAPPRAMSLGCS